MDTVRKTIREMEGYVPGRQPGGSFSKLNANENPYPPSPRALAVLGGVAGDALRLYPSASAERLRETAARVFGVASDMVVVGNGSDDIFTMVIRTFLDAGDVLAVVDPTYTLYETLAEIQDARTERHSLKEDFSLPESFFESAAKLKILPNPNAQTGNLFPESDLRRLCATAKGAVVIDEAYALFAGYSALGLLKEFPNLVVTRTMSKSHSLAGLRVGFGMAAPEIIGAMLKVKDSYNVNAVSQLAAAAALEDGEYTAGVVRRIMATQADFAKGLAGLGWTVYPSRSNFVLARPACGTADEIMAYMEENGFLVRHFTTERLFDKIRFSIGTEEQMRRILELLADWNQKRG